MLELNVAPTPSPVANSADPAASAKTSSSADNTANSTSNADGKDGSTPFATVLQHQMAHPAESKTAGKADAKAAPKAVSAALDLDIKASVASAATTDATAQTPKDDALAFLAPMLPGLTPATQTQSAKDDTAKSDKEDAAPTLIAAALPIDVAASPALQGKTGEATKSAQSAQTADIAAKTSANLAAEAPVVAENTEQSGKSRSAAETGFESLLNTSREASMAAANSASAHGGNVPVAPVQAGNGVTTTQVATPVGNHGWDGEVGEKIAWMANRNESRADLVLNPPHLGRIEVSLSVNGDQANVSFASANPAVREALENAVPKLREVLQGAGISLGQTQVGAESFQQQANNRENGDNPNRGNSSGRGIDTALSNVVSTGSSSASQWLRRGNGLVDTFA